MSILVVISKLIPTIGLQLLNEVAVSFDQQRFIRLRWTPFILRRRHIFLMSALIRFYYQHSKFMVILSHYLNTGKF